MIKIGQRDEARVKNIKHIDNRQSGEKTNKTLIKAKENDYGSTKMSFFN